MTMKNLTAAQERLFEVMINPMFYGTTITVRCKEAGVSRDVYYNAIQNPVFLEKVRLGALCLIQERLHEVVEATIYYATHEKSANVDRRMLLEMAGLLNNKIVFERSSIKEKGATKEELIKEYEMIKERVDHLLEGDKNE